MHTKPVRSSKCPPCEMKLFFPGVRADQASPTNGAACQITRMHGGQGRKDPSPRANSAKTSITELPRRGDPLIHRTRAARNRTLVDREAGAPFSTFATGI